MTHPNTLSADLVAAMRARRRNGATYQQIAAEFGISLGVCGKYLKGMLGPKQYTRAGKRARACENLDDRLELVPARLQIQRQVLGLDPITGAPS